MGETIEGKIGMVSVIPKDMTESQPTMEKSLREKGMSMFPGTFKMYFPYRERSGAWRTGLDPNASYIQNIRDESIKAVEIDRVTKLRDQLQKKTGLDLSPDSDYWKTIYPVKLSDGDNIFDLTDAERAIQFAWLRVHPLVAKSMESYLNGEFPPDTHFYVKDNDIETEIAYRKNKAINTAIGKVEAYSLEKRRKVARLVGLPIDEETKEQIVYNALDAFLRSPVIKDGPYKGQDSIRVFNSIANLDDNHLYIRDLVNTLILKNIYRESTGGAIMEGTMKRWNSRTEMINFYLDEGNQANLFEEEQKLKIKQLV